MSTRANIKIKGELDNELIFYRHSDGYPESVVPDLKKFLKWAKEGKIRRNAQQASGWLIMIGAEQYNYKFENNETKKLDAEKVFTPEGKSEIRNWKVGVYEPTCEIHGDIEYLYEVDLKNLEIVVKDVIDGTEKRIRV